MTGGLEEASQNCKQVRGRTFRSWWKTIHRKQTFQAGNLRGGSGEAAVKGVMGAGLSPQPLLPLVKRN